MTISVVDPPATSQRRMISAGSWARRVARALTTTLPPGTGVCLLGSAQMLLIPGDPFHATH